MNLHVRSTRTDGPRRGHGNRQRIWQVTAWLLLLTLIVSPVYAAQDSSSLGNVNYAGKVSRDVWQTAVDGEETSFIIFLKDQADLSAAYKIKNQDARGWYVYNKLTQHAAQTQAPIIAELAAEGASYTSYWAANMIVAEGDLALIAEMAARPDVKVIESNEGADWILDGEDGPTGTDEGDSTEEANFTTPGLGNVNAPLVWNLGFNGQGIVVANQDTGMRWTHSALIGKYRGWNGVTADHNYNWHDSVHARITTADGGTGSPAGNSCGYNAVIPCDDQGHGTHTTGTIIGDGGAGTAAAPNQIGVAPGAKWIGCRNMDAGNGRPSTYSECFQFFIAPTDLNNQNPNPALRPHVINNSWTCPPSELCAVNTLFTITENTRAAGIFVVVSAANDGPNCSTVQDPPAIYPGSFSVGAINGTTNALASFSSRGPVTSDGSGRMKPDISAPGQTVRSSLRTSDTAYGNMSGTSMAGPHVVGAVALLWSARPNLVRDEGRTKWLLTRSANPAVTVPNNSAGCGGIASIPNNHFGWGRIDVLAAYNLEPSLYQTITFGALSGKTYGDADFNVSATASSGLAVSYSASGNCSVSGNTVHITGAGSCTVTASQEGYDDYGIATSAQKPWYPASNVSQSFNIAKATPTVSWSNPADILLGTALSGTQLNATASTSGSFVYTPAAGTVLAVGAGQPLHVDFTPSDTANYNGASADVTINVIFDFSGFFAPIDNLPTVNTANSGQAIPIKFSLGGDQGMSIFAAGYPKSQQVACNSSAPLAPVEEIATPGASGLSYGGGQYNYVWKTEKAWKGTCRLLSVKLTDSTEHTALFNFTK